MGNLLHRPNHRLSLSFQQISSFSFSFKKVIMTGFFFFFSFFLQVRLSSLHLQFAYKCSVVQVGAFFIFYFNQSDCFHGLRRFIWASLLIQRSSKFEQMDHDSKFAFVFHCLFLVMVSGSGKKRQLDEVHRSSSNSRKPHLN